MSVCTPVALAAGTRVPGAAPVLPPPVMLLLSLPAPACASTLALTNAAGLAVKAYGGVQVALLDTGGRPTPHR